MIKLGRRLGEPDRDDTRYHFLKFRMARHGISLRQAHSLRADLDDALR